MAMWNMRGYSRFIAMTAFGVCLTGVCWTARAQSQSDTTPSVAEAARRAREQKKHEKPVRTITNEDLPPAPPDGLNGVSSTASGATKPDEAASADQNNNRETAATPATSAAPAATRGNGEISEQKKAENAVLLARAKKELAFAETELNILQRKAALDSESFYSKADFANDKEGKANLDAEAQQVNDKKNAVEALKARVAELQKLVGEQPETEPGKNPPPH